MKEVKDHSYMKRLEKLRFLYRILYSGLGSSAKTSECNIETGGHTKKCDKTNKKCKRLQLQGGII